jgi:hypothetical protein
MSDNRGTLSSARLLVVGVVGLGQYTDDRRAQVDQHVSQPARAHVLGHGRQRLRSLWRPWWRLLWRW